jgi:predicted RNA-binding Zn ribbon-like protein
MGFTFDRTGDHLALDFSNTVNGRTTPSPIERLTAYADLIEFARQTELLSDAEARALRRRADADPEEAARVHHLAVELRDALYSAFSSITRGEPPQESDLRVLNQHVSRMRLTSECRLEYHCGEGLDAPLGPIVRAALDLITGSRERVRLCAADDCGFLFLDTSKNRSRRWCDMKQCGNREKARRHHARVRGRDDGP